MIRSFVLQADIVAITGAGTFHDYTVKNCTDSQLVNSADINAFATATFGKGIKPGSIVASAMADEPAILMQNVRTPPNEIVRPLYLATHRLSFDPGTYLEQVWIPTDTSSIVQSRWVDYLKSKGMTPPLLGESSWAAVEPYKLHPRICCTSPLIERRAYKETFLSEQLARLVAARWQGPAAAHTAPPFLLVGAIHPLGRLSVYESVDGSPADCQRRPALSGVLSPINNPLAH